MNKSELVKKVSKSTRQSKRVTKEVLEALLESIGDTMAGGHNIEIRGFGSFKVKKRKARVARNPRTGALVKIPPRFVPTFKPSQQLWKKVEK